MSLSSDIAGTPASSSPPSSPSPTLSVLGLPLEGVALLLGIDAMLDMMRTESAGEHALETPLGRDGDPGLSPRPGYKQWQPA